MKFLENDRVVIYGTGALDGVTGTICGRGSTIASPLEDDTNFPAGWSAYIIKIDDEHIELLKQVDYHYSCIHITDSCIKRIP